MNRSTVRLMTTAGVLLVSVATLYGVAAASQQPVTTPERPSPEILQQASRLSGGNVGELRRIEDEDAFSGTPAARIREYVESSTGNQFLVDTSDGQVVSYIDDEVLRDMYLPTDAPLLSEQELLGLAREYVRSNMPRWHGFNAESKVVEVGAAHEAHVTFTEYFAGIPTSNRLELLMNPTTGSVASVVVHDGDVTVSETHPALSEGDAIQTVAEAAIMPVRSRQSATLRIWRAPGEATPQLTYLVELQTGDETLGASCIGVVDARTGDIILLAE